jgi:RNA polymerase sigma factor (TIGR02999 family)
LLNRWSNGDHDALDELAPLVYEHLYRLAQNAFRGENSAHTLQPTAIVNETFLHLVDKSVDWQDRGHFYSLAARMMRRILVNHANARKAAKRGGGQKMVTFNDDLLGNDEPGDEIIELDEALKALAGFDTRMSEMIELHYFGGLTYSEAAKVLGVSEATAKRDLRFGKSWIRRYIDEASRQDST